MLKLDAFSRNVKFKKNQKKSVGLQTGQQARYASFLHRRKGKKKI